MVLPPFVLVGYYQSGYIFGPKDNLKLIAFRGSCAAMAFLTGTFSTVLIPLSEASLYNNSFPAMLAFLVWLLGMESVDFLSWVGIFGTLFSQVLIARPAFLFGGESDEWDVNRYLGILCAFLSVFGKTVGFAIIGKIDKNVPSVIIANHAAFQLLCYSLPFLPTGFPKELNFSPSWMDVLLYVLGAFSAFNQLFMVRSFQIGPPIKAAVVSLARVLMLMALGVVVCSEEITPLFGVGAVLMLASILLVIWRKDKIRQSKQVVPVDTSPPTPQGPQSSV